MDVKGLAQQIKHTSPRHVSFKGASTVQIKLSPSTLKAIQTNKASKLDMKG